jgi:hypothetical protein
MKQNFLIDSDLSVGNNLDDADNEFETNDDTNDDDEFWLFDDDSENDDNEEDDDWWFPSKSYNGWDYKRDFGEEALEKLYKDREARQRFILLRLFTMRLPNITEQAKNGLFIAFSKSNSFGVLEHNALLNALAHPVRGLNLFEYDELGFDLIKNVK